MARWVGRAPSRQECAALELLVQGYKNYEIGRRLGASEETVKKHVSAMLHKSGAWNRAELAARAIADGIVPPPPGHAAGDEGLET